MAASTTCASQTRADARASTSPHQPREQLSPAELIETCLWIWDTHDDARVSLDAHVGACLERQRVLDGDDQCFIRQVVYGLHRFRPFLSSFLSGFFHANR